MKKCISCLLAALLTCRCIPSGAWTETAAAEDNTPLIAAAEISAEPGETVTVPLTVLHNPGIAALSLSITYDASMLTLLDAQSKAEWNTAVFLAGGDKTQSPYVLNWDSEASADYSSDGLLAELQFAVAEGVTGETVIGISVNQGSTFHADFTDAVFDTQNSLIRIAAATTTSTTETTTTTTTTTTATTTATTEATTTTTEITTTETEPVPVQADYLRGDVDNSGNVDVADAQITLNAYTKVISGKPTGLTDQQFRAANVNLDDVLSVEDAQYILQYYARNTLSKKTTTWEQLIK